MQQDINEHNETVINETESYNKNSVRKDMSNLKNDMEEMKEPLKAY